MTTTNFEPIKPLAITLLVMVLASMVASKTAVINMNPIQTAATSSSTNSLVRPHLLIVKTFTTTPLLQSTVPSTYLQPAATTKLYQNTSNL